MNARVRQTVKGGRARRARDECERDARVRGDGERRGAASGESATMGRDERARDERDGDDARDGRGTTLERGATRRGDGGGGEGG